MGLPFSTGCLGWGDGVPQDGGREAENIPAVSSPEIGDSEGAAW